MIGRGKNINLFLMDGEPSGRIKCTLANWTEAVVFTTSNNSFGPTDGNVEWKTGDGRALKDVE